jgi:hypothetical protein
MATGLLAWTPTEASEFRNLAVSAAFYPALAVWPVAAVSARPRNGSKRRPDLTSLRWKHLSSKEGDLPVPGASEQQTSALVLDVDKDGRQDFILGFRQAAPALVWYRNTKRGWARQVIEPEFLTVEAGGAACDIDGDGDPDVIFGGDWQSSKVWWWENPYPRFDKPWVRHEIKSTGGTQQHDQIVGDFDGDGKPDLAFWNQGAKALYWTRIPKNPKTGPWPYARIFSGSGEGMAKGDVDGDGREDLLAGGRWFKYNGGERFAAYAIDPGQDRPRMAAGDLNRDGRLDVVMVSGDGVGRLKWYEYKGDPKKAEDWIGHDLLGKDVIHGHTLAVADVNGDGALDIFCGEMAKWTESAPKPDHPDAKIWVLLGDGRGNFTKTEVATGYGIHEGRLADFNGDGRPDILDKPYNWDVPRIDLWLNEGPDRAKKGEK